MSRLRISTPLFLFPILVFCVRTAALCQPAHPVRLTSFIGDTVDRYESELYDLGFDSEGYHWAVFTMDRDSVLDAWVSSQRTSDQVPVLRRLPRYQRYRALMEDLMEKEKKFLEGRHSGSNVRITMESGEVVGGELIAVSDTVVLVNPSGGGNGDLRSLNRSAIMGCIRPGGSNVGKGMLIGTGSGACLGFLLGLAGGDDDAGLIRFSAGEKGAILAVGLGATGFLLGTIVGFASPTDDVHVDHTDTRTMRMFSKYPLGESMSLR